MTQSSDPTTTWPDLGIALYDRLTGRNAEITYDFNDMQVGVPSSTGSSAERATWHLNGVLRVRTREVSDSEK